MEGRLTLSGPYPTLVFYSGKRQTILVVKGRPLGQQRVKQDELSQCFSSKPQEVTLSKDANFTRADCHLRNIKWIPFLDTVIQTRVLTNQTRE